MVELTEEQAKKFCDRYCRFPYTVEGDDLEQICNMCPLSGGEDGGKKKKAEV